MFDEKTMLRYHLQYNHFPPHSDDMVDCVYAALQVVKSGDLEAMIELPDGISHRIYGDRVPVTILLDSVHIDPLYYADEEEF